MPAARAELEGCDDELTWDEVTAALRRTRRGKAAGWDAIPGEVLKLVEDEVEPESRLAAAIWKMIRKMWKHGRVPGKWNKAVIVPIPKKGDRRDPNNYRGISLIPAVARLYGKIMTNRLVAIAENNNLLAKEQAGFRNREECVAQATTLYEVLLRRTNTGKTSYGIFIDFAKAYDKVPHEGLLRKLRCMGIRGKLYKGIRSLYKSPKVCVRSGAP